LTAFLNESHIVKVVVASVCSVKPEPSHEVNKKHFKIKVEPR